MKREIEFEIEDDKIYKYVSIPDSIACYEKIVVMDKVTFIKAYKKWIIDEQEQNEK